MGKTYIYNFTIADRAGTYWYHPHPHGRTGPQVYAGLAGLFVIHDEEEKGLGLPSGDYDLSIVIQDRSFDKDNQLIYGGNGMMGGMSLPHPMHVHSLQYQVIEREISSSGHGAWTTLSNGHVDEGWHDAQLSRRCMKYPNKISEKIYGMVFL